MTTASLYEYKFLYLNISRIWKRPHCLIALSNHIFLRWKCLTSGCWKQEANCQICWSLSPLGCLVLIISDISKKASGCLLSITPLACGLLVVKKKGHNVTHGVTKRMHGKLVIRYYCLYRNLLRSWANPFPFVSNDRIIFHGLSRGRPYSEWTRMGSSAQRGT
jgi:hypothetical protein